MLPNYDTETKTLSFNSEVVHKCILYYKDTYYFIPQDEIVTNTQSTSSVQLIFNIITKEFSFQSFDESLSENDLRVGVLKTIGRDYSWDFPCDITINGQPSVLQGSFGNTIKKIEDDVLRIQNLFAQNIPLEEWEIGTLTL